LRFCTALDLASRHALFTTFLKIRTPSLRHRSDVSRCSLPRFMHGRNPCVRAAWPEKAEILHVRAHRLRQSTCGHRHFLQYDRFPITQVEGESMKTIQLLKTAGSIACVAFALNATAQTNASPPPASSETLGQHFDDGTVTTKVKAELLSTKDVKSTHIHVKTRKGIVWLTGSVPTADEKVAAQDAVQNVEGVKGVRNHLKIAAE
jgi:hyperosmotically inducible protein